MIVDTSKWSHEALAPYTKGITALFKRLAERFPNDVTVQGLFDDCVSGRKILWLVLDVDLALRGIAMTKLDVTRAGAKVGTLVDLAGDGMRDWVDEVFSELEAYAVREGCELVAAEGRSGWREIMKKHGYREHAVLWRKVA